MYQPKANTATKQDRPPAIGMRALYRLNIVGYIVVHTLSEHLMGWAIISQGNPILCVYFLSLTRAQRCFFFRFRLLTFYYFILFVYTRCTRPSSAQSYMKNMVNNNNAKYDAKQNAMEFFFSVLYTILISSKLKRCRRRWWQDVYGNRKKRISLRTHPRPNTIFLLNCLFHSFFLLFGRLFQWKEM